MNRESKPDNWDWVKARSRCSATVMCAELINMARLNAQQRSETGTDEEKRRERFLFRVQHGDQSFSVSDSWGNYGAPRAVVFSIDHVGRILVLKNFEREETIYTLALSDDGECRLMADGLAQ